jgi:hypothetical protein
MTSAEVVCLDVVNGVEVVGRFVDGNFCAGNASRSYLRCSTKSPVLQVFENTGENVWLGGRDSSRVAARAARWPKDVPTRPYERAEGEWVWLGVRDGIRNYLITAA